MKIKREPIPCPVDPYCRNWDQHNETCQDHGCKESGFKKITVADIEFYTNKRILESEFQILKTKEREIENSTKLSLDTVNYNKE